MISVNYFLLLIVTFIGYWIVTRQLIRNYLLLVSSCLFILLLDVKSLLVVLVLSAITYLFGRLIHRYPKKSWVHISSVLFVLSVLVLFKYLGFFTGILNSLASFISILPLFKVEKLVLPLGISYIVFKHISYLTDIKWCLVKPGRFIDFLLYSSLFTIFVAGPIERFERFKPQAEQPIIPFSWENVDYGVMRIVFGLFKKLVLADWIGYIINPVWSSPHQYSYAIRLLALVAYSFQIYFDFAGYSDIAIGSSRLFGFKIMENFNNPYLASNISQFWRRWHISLSDWIRDYLFFPLSRISTKNLWQVFFVPVIAMALCGLWHGAAWSYVIWGLWHGFGLFLYQIWSGWKRSSKPLRLLTQTLWFKTASLVASFSYVTMGWYWFHS